MQERLVDPDRLANSWNSATLIFLRGIFTSLFAEVVGSISEPLELPSTSVFQRNYKTLLLSNSVQ